jgi:hypothetical protein
VVARAHGHLFFLDKALTAPTLQEALRTSATPPEGQEASAWALARGILHEGKAPEGAEALPATLLEALLDALVEARSTAPIEALADSRHKPTAKAARRAQYRLRSAGVVTKGPSPAPPPVVPEAEGPTELPSLVGPPDGAGEFLLMVARGVKGGLALHDVLLSDELGLVAHREFEMSRSAWRRTLREARPEPVREISLAEARGILAEGLRNNLATHSPLPKGADAMLRRLDVSAAAAPPPALPVPEEGDAALALEADRLHEEPELRGWLPPEDELKLFSARVQEVRTSPLALSDAQRTEQLLERVHSMAVAFFTQERSRLYALRLWRTAETFERTGRGHAAQVARAEARRLYHQSPGLFSRFAETLYGKLLQHLPAPPGPGGTPAAAPAEATPASTERRSKGGLILP